MKLFNNKRKIKHGKISDFDREEKDRNLRKRNKEYHDYDNDEGD